MKIVIPEPVEFYSDEQREVLKSLGAEWLDHVPSSDEEMRSVLEGADVVALKWPVLSDGVVESLINLKHIVTMSVGYNMLPLDALKKKGVTVSNCPHHSAESVAEHAIALMFALVKNLVRTQRSLAAGTWKPTLNAFMGEDLRGKQLLLVGDGTIGSKAGQIARQLGMRTSFVNSKTSDEEFTKLLSEADIVSLHVPLTNSTRHLINDQRIRTMKKTAYLINTARGDVVDQKALVAALKEGRIAGAGIDVFEGEPKKIADSISDGIRELAGMDNVVATPHIAYNTQASWFRLGDELIENLRAIIAGQPINTV